MRHSTLCKKAAVTALVCLFSFNTMAQQDSDVTKTSVKDSSQAIPMEQEVMDHSAMGHDPKSEKIAMQPENQSQEVQPVNHSTMGHKSNGEMQSMQEMDHSKMPDKSDITPANRRDPHAYSDGLALDSGAFALPGERQLVLADEHAFWSVLFNRFEYADGLSKGLGNAKQYDMQGWYGKDYNRLVVKLEGEIVDNKLEGSESQILWGHAFTKFWDTQLGVRFDTFEGPSKEWLVFGVQGLAPYWFEVNTSLSVGAEGRTAFDLEAEYELLITQRLILQPRVVLSAYGKDDPENGVGKGLSSVTTGLRLRYEFSREFAPYLGIEWTGKYGNTADFTKLEGGSTKQTQWVAGIRFLF
jgi:copper resistance protein B